MEMLRDNDQKRKESHKMSRDNDRHISLYGNVT